jgi:pimeloyl-ACP methyl ester carboxylesterase
VKGLKEIKDFQGVVGKMGFERGAPSTALREVHERQVDADRQRIVTPSEQMLDVRGTRHRVLRAGSGPPLIFLHGASGHVGWLPFLERLSATFDVIAPEHPGFGFSDDAPWLDRTSDLAYFYLDFIEALKLDGVHLIGTSLGGWVAAELAIRSTARLASLTLVCAVGIVPDGRPIDDLFRISAEENARRFYFDPERARPRVELLVKADPGVLVRNRSTVVRLAYPHFANPDLAKWLHRINVRTLLIWGANDGLVPIRFGETYQRLIPDSSLVVIPEAGHAPFEEKPEAFLAALMDFLQ